MAITLHFALKDLGLVSAFLISLCMAQMPSINLPWGQYNASIYDPTNQIYTWRNVRFGHNTAETRFQASIYPRYNFDDSNHVNGLACPQVDTTNAACVDQSNGTYLPYNKNSGEDCLFLDLYVPASAIQHAAKGIYNTTVVIWIHGGAFVFGSKDTSLGGPYNNALYNGTGPLIASQGNMIMVAGNYRLGAFGWLAGPAMETQGYPNAGLSDQRLLFQWVQDYISQVGGNKNSVSAWGESAGASSILHHLISRDPSTGGLMPSRFSRVAIQSPAYEWQWDPVSLNNTYNTYAKLAHCPNCSVSTLKDFPYEALAQANQNLFQSPISFPCTGLFPLGPSIDHKVIQHLTPVALNGTQGKDFQSLDSMIVSHVTNEAATFIPWYLKKANHPTDAEFQMFLQDFIPEQSLKYLIPIISNQYNVSKFQNSQTLRAKALIQDAVFVCNTRHLFDAYNNSPTKYYAMSYDVFDLGDGLDLAVHASDVPAIFYNQWWNVSAFVFNEVQDISPLITYKIVDILVQHWKNITAVPYQAYWTSLARFGNPNLSKPHPIDWNLASVASVEGDVLISNTIQPQIQTNDSNTYWFIINDTQNGWNKCNFWREIAMKVEASIQEKSLDIVSPKQFIKQNPNKQQYTLVQD